MKKVLLILLVGFAALAGCKPADPVSPEPGPKDDPWKDANITGTVCDASGKGIEGVVVSDGHVCCATNAEGRYGLKSSFENTDFVWVSTPSGYSAPVNASLPVFYKRLDACTKDNNGIYSGVDFTLSKIASPDKFTLIIAADPQPRSTAAGYDKIGYHAFDCVGDMSRDMKEKAASISGPVYGIMLGDVCHNDCSLYPKYLEKISTCGFPMYHIIGNHDHDLKKVGDIESGKTFESYFGPTNYSFNLGNCHFVMLDNMMVVSKSRESNSGDDLGDGLRDDIWAWLQNDMKYVDSSKTIMLCVHSPMYYTMGGELRTRKSIIFDGKGVSNHYADVDALLAKYDKVYAWAGHTHSSYNYVDKNNPHTETHTLVRVTGQLWTNEWENSGTPRGYTVLEYSHGDITWKFKPIYYQSGKHCLSSQPAYNFREWNYDGGVAKMKDGGANLDDNYQMHVYAPGTYAQGDNLVYANIFLWDEMWKTPKWTTNGYTTSMKRVTNGGKNLCPDYSSLEINSWYKTNSSTLKKDANYSAEADNTASMFTVSVNSVHGTGTVSVEDRFGRTYKQTIEW